MVPVARQVAAVRIPMMRQVEWEVAVRQGAWAVVAQAWAVRAVVAQAWAVLAVVAPPLLTRLPTGTLPLPTFQ
jgi:hypothetical protein